MASSDELKALGNAAFSAGRFDEAIKHFTDAIAVDPSNHVLFSNRSAAQASLFKYPEALEDADQCIALKPEWGKGYGRRGAALHGLHRYEDAISAYEQGLQHDSDSDVLKRGLADAQRAAAGPGPVRGFGAIFSSPEFLARVATDPRTKPYMTQPDFLSMIREASTNPRVIEKYAADPRFQEALSIGLEMVAGPGSTSATAAGMAAAAGGNAPPEGMNADDAAAWAAAEELKQRSKAEEAAKAAAKKRAQEEAAAAAAAAAAAPRELSEDDKAREAGNAAKEEGNAAYKAKNFEAAIEAYNRALELYDKDISYLTNRAAVKYEQNDFAGCIADCDAAVERGRELRADYKLVARAMTRKGNALVKQGDLEAAVDVYNRSLTEHRNADTLKRLQEAEKLLKDTRETAYVNLDMSTEEKDKGNAAFKEQRYPEAVAHYTDALKRGPAKVNPEAYKLFSNRAACYTKLGAWNEGLKDAEECIALAPDFPKGYSRKGHLQFFMKEYEKAIETYQAGLSRDPDNAELKEGLMRCVGAINRMSRGEASEAEVAERQQRAMADPEVQSILSDPIMRQVLSEMQEDPAAAQKHMSHPEVARKIEKLVSAGVIQTR